MQGAGIIAGAPLPAARADAGDQETEMSEEDLERYETDVELQIYQEYRDVLPMFRYVVETERRFYLANKVDLRTRDTGAGVFFEIDMEDAWVWDMYRPARFLKKVRVLTFRDVNLEEVEHPELRPSDADAR